MPEWATFHGSANDLGHYYELTAAGGNGVFTIAKDAVSFEHHKISIKVGAIVTIIKGSESLNPLASYVPNDSCARSCSIGMVEICADDGRVLGPCQIPALV